MCTNVRVACAQNGFACDQRQLQDAHIIFVYVLMCIHFLPSYCSFIHKILALWKCTVIPLPLWQMSCSSVLGWARCACLFRDCVSGTRLAKDAMNGARIIYVACGRDASFTMQHLQYFENKAHMYYRPRLLNHFEFTFVVFFTIKHFSLSMIQNA